MAHTPLCVSSCQEQNAHELWSCENWLSDPFFISHDEYTKPSQAISLQLFYQSFWYVPVYCNP